MSKKTEPPDLSLVHEPQIKNLSKMEILSMKWLQAEARCLSEMAERKKLERDIYLKKIDPSNQLLAMDNEIRMLWKQHEEYKLKYGGAIGLIETRLSISMKNYSYDDETGALLHIAE